MKKGIFIIVMLCASFISYAQVEQSSQRIAETEHKKLASDLSTALRTGKGKPAFGNAGKDKQFLLEDNEQTFTAYLGWKKTQFDKRNLTSVFQGLLSAAKQKDAKKKVSVRVSFPLDGTEFKGPATNTSGKAIKDAYVVSTTAEVAVEAGKQGTEKSLAKNNLTLNWEVLLKVDKKTGAVDTKGSRAILRSISVETSSGYFLAERQRMQSVAEQLIKDYYQSLRDASWSAVEIPDEWRSPLQTSIKRETEGNVSVSLPSSTSFEVSAVPSLKIFVDPEAYHKVALGFRIAIDDDLSSGRITSVRYTELEKPKIVVVAEPEPEPVIAIQPEPQPVVRESGTFYKVQILSLFKPIALSDLPSRYRMDNVMIEKYVVGGVTYFKYVVPGGTTLNEALAVRRQMREKGIEDAWIAIYENGVRIAPNEGTPETIIAL